MYFGSVESRRGTIRNNAGLISESSKYSYRKQKIAVFDHPTIVWRSLSREPPRKIRSSVQTLYCQKLESLVYMIFAAASVGLSFHSNFHGWFRNTRAFWNRLRNDCSRSSKVVDFGTNRKRVFDFLLVINSISNLGPILTVSKILQGFRYKQPSHPNSTRNQGIFPLD